MWMRLRSRPTRLRQCPSTRRRASVDVIVGEAVCPRHAVIVMLLVVLTARGGASVAWILCRSSSPPGYRGAGTFRRNVCYPITHKAARLGKVLIINLIQN